MRAKEVALRLLAEEEDHEHLYHTSHQHEPIDGHKRKFKEPVTWFFSNRHDHGSKYPAEKEANAIHERSKFGGDRSAINVYKPKHNLNLASEEHVQEVAKHTGHPHHDGPAFEILDHRITGEKEHTHKVINHLKGEGYHGAENDDYSQVNHEHDRKSVALFHPHDHLDHVRTYE